MFDENDTKIDLEQFLNNRIKLHCGDCLEVLPTLAENSVDSCVTDPPYHLTNIVKRFGAENAAPAQFGKDGAYARASAGFMGKKWDGGDIAFRSDVWRQVYRVLKPGAHILAFGATRNYHRMACAIEDAGFEIRDTIMWIYGSGFPKSHDVSKGIDKAAGAERDIIEFRDPTEDYGFARNRAPDQSGSHIWSGNIRSNKAATDAARQWEGWGTALKPALEPIVLARKPLSESTVAANVLKWGVGALNIDGCRIPTVWATDPTARGWQGQANNGWSMSGHTKAEGEKPKPNILGRWPANLIHDGSQEVVGAFPESDHVAGNKHATKENGGGIFGGGRRMGADSVYQDSGSAARFFKQCSDSGKRFHYTAKADSDERIGSGHPTVKPLDLMQYLIRLVTPKGGVVLDPFAGTGTTGEAAWREGMNAILIEAEMEYQNDIRRRMALTLAGPDERMRESIKAKNLPRDDGPLFSGMMESEYNAEDDFARSIDECYAEVRARKAAGGKGWPE